MSQFQVKILVAVLLLFHSLALAQPSDIDITVSSNEGARLKRVASIPWKSDSKEAVFQIQAQQLLQEMDGFGASFMEAGAIVLNSLPIEKQEEVLKFIFDQETGVGFSAAKTPIAATDFMCAGPWYSYDEVPGDVNLDHFTVKRDLHANGTLTLLKRAKKYSKELKIQATMDYPPDWMFSGDLPMAEVPERYFPAIANYYLRFLQEYEKNGVQIDYFSTFNEHYSHISFDATARLFKEALHPQTGTTITEMPSREEAFNYITYTTNTYPETLKYIDILFYHGYDCQWNCTPADMHFDRVKALHDLYPTKKLWMTEVCYALEFGQYPPPPVAPPLPRNDFANGANWSYIQFNDIENGASAWIYWNLFLDQNGGPWTISPEHNDPNPNIQQPMIIINTQTQEVEYTGCFWFLSHFSKFVRPGYNRLNVIQRDGYDDDRIHFVAFVNKERKKYVANILNMHSSEQQVSLSFDSYSVDIKLPAISITTLQWTDQTYAV